MSPARALVKSIERKLSAISKTEQAKIAADAAKHAQAVSERERLTKEHEQAIRDLAVENYHTAQQRHDRAIQLALGELATFREACEDFAKAHARMLGTMMALDSTCDVHASPPRVFHGSAYAPRPVFTPWVPDLPGVHERDFLIDGSEAIAPAYQEALAKLDA